MCICTGRNALSGAHSQLLIRSRKWTDTQDPLLTDWDALDAVKFVDEEDTIAALLKAVPLDAGMRAAAVRRGRELVMAARAKGRPKGMMESFLEEFGLSNSEGLALMCLAEALLRVPDAETRDDLISEKIRSGRLELP